MFKNLSLKYKLIIMNIGILIAGFVILIIYSSINIHRVSAKSDFQKVDISAAGYANDISKLMTFQLGQSKVLSEIFENYESIPTEQRREQYINMLKSIFEKNKDYFGIWTAWEENAIDGNDEKYKKQPGHNRNGRFVPYWNRIYGEEPTLDQLVGFEELDFYKVPKEAVTEVVTDPYLYEASRGAVMLATSSHPIMNNGKFVGAVGIDFDLSIIQDKVKDLKPFGYGYVFITSNDGQIIAHKDKSKIGLQLEEVYKDCNAKNKILENIKNNKNFNITTKLTSKEEVAYVSFFPITFGDSAKKWSLAVVFPETIALQETTKNLFSMIGISLIVVFISIWIVILSVGQISKPIRKASQALKDISQGEADLTKKLPVENRDEIGEMAISFNELMKTFGNIVFEINNTSGNVNEFAENLLAEIEEIVGRDDKIHKEITITELKKSMDNVQLNVTNQTSATEETAFKIQEIAKMLKDTSEKAKLAAQLSKETEKEAKIGGKAVQNTLDGMNRLEKIVTEIENKTENLNIASHDIGKILVVITNLADQTNLLALNAAIEAARAGEAGKGFSVVANEVKKLAKQTQEATEEIDNLISTIQNATKDVMNSSKTGYEEVLKTKQLSTDAEKNIGNIVVKIEKTNTEVEKISGFVEIQSDSIQEVSDTIQVIAEGSSKINQLSEHQNEGLDVITLRLEKVLEESEDLRGIIGRLREIVSKFRT